MLGRVRLVESTAAAIMLAIALVATAMFAAGVAPARAQAETPQLTTAAQATSTDDAIEAGIYYIQSSLPGSAMLDVTGASTSNGANVQIWETNGTAAQRWRITPAAGGTYTIRCAASGKYLDISGKVGSTSNVLQWKQTGDATQRWLIEKNGNGYIICPEKKPNCALDVTGASSSNGTNVWLYEKNGTEAQKWWLVPAKPKVASERVLDDGIYEMLLTAKPSYAVDLADSAYSNGTNVRLWKRSGTTAQRWRIEWESDGFYSIRNVSSGKLLDVAGTGCAVRGNVQSWSLGKAADRRWAISKNKNGSYTLTSKASGLALDVAGGKAANGANIRTWLRKAGKSQQFNIVAAAALPEGACTLYTMLAPTAMAVDIPGASNEVGLRAQIYTGNGTMAQRFYLRQADEGTYTIQAANSGLYLTDASGKVVQRKRTGAASQQWRASIEGNGIVFANVATGKRLAVSGGKAKDGAKLATVKAASKNAQRFRVVSTRLVSDGCYTLRNLAAKKVLDVAGKSNANKANVQVCKASGGTSQTWYITHVGAGYYRLIDVKSGKALEVADASKKAGANVRQNAYTKKAAQLWKPAMGANGGIVFENKASGKVLEVASTKNGANVRQGIPSGKSSQGWRLQAVDSGNIWRELELKYLDDSSVKQILEVQYWGGSDAWVELRVKKGYTWKTALSCWGYVGAEGIGQASMYSTRTPSGDFGITHAYGIKSNPGGGLPYVQVTQNMWWCGDRVAYNQLIDISQIPHNCDGEHLIDYAPHYNYGLFFDYNTNPVVYGAGAAFFVHCTGGSTSTGGCVAVPEWYMKRIIRKLSPGARLCIY